MNSAVMVNIVSSTRSRLFREIHLWASLSGSFKIRLMRQVFLNCVQYHSRGWGQRLRVQNKDNSRGWRKSSAVKRAYCCSPRGLTYNCLKLPLQGSRPPQLLAFLGIVFTMHFPLHRHMHTYDEMIPPTQTHRHMYDEMIPPKQTHVHTSDQMIPPTQTHVHT